MPLSRIAALSATVGQDWRSPVADAVAARWALPPGAARFWRSSARHVFVVRVADGAAYLRFVPSDLVSRADEEAVAALMQELSLRGSGCVPVVPSSSGHLVETVTTDMGEMHAVMVMAAAGEQLDDDELSTSDVRAWGSALGRVHRDGTAASTTIALGDGATRIEQALARVEADVALAATARALRARLQRLPRNSDSYGLVHGDYELDNLAWLDGVPTAFDWDEAETSWFAADVAYAVRDLTPDGPALIDGSAPLIDDFLDGYREERPGAEIDREQLALFAAVNALRSLDRLRPVLAEDAAAGDALAVPAPEGADPPPSLRSRLEAYADKQRRLACDLVSALD
jgi:Ser/Thr protein kinase RdoA (MazF antagonist)